MFYSLLLLFSTYFLASGYRRRCVRLQDRTKKKCGLVTGRSDAKLIYFVLVTTFVLFSGLRSFNNDTGNYIAMYLYGYSGYFSEITAIPFEDGYLYEVLTVLGKMIFGDNYAKFLTFIALLTLGSYLKFFKKYATDFPLAVYLLTASTFLSFSMAAMRQCLSMAIAIWAVPCFCNKKYLRGFIWLVLGICIHKFVAVFAMALFLKNDVWDKKTLLIIGATVAVSTSFSVVFTNISEATGYAESSLVNSAGTNLLRTLVWLMPVVLSFVYRKAINAKCDLLGKVFINLSLIGSMIMVLASFGGANLIARMAYYFYPFFILSFAEIITGAMNRRDSKLFRMLCMIGFFAYFVLLSKGNGGFFEDYYRHNSIFDLFRSYLSIY